MASAMLVEQRLQGSIDQVEQLIHFTCAAATHPSHAAATPRAAHPHPPHPHLHPPFTLTFPVPSPATATATATAGPASARRCGRSDSRSDALHAFDTQIEHICRSVESIAGAITKKQLPQLATSS